MKRAYLVVVLGICMWFLNLSTVWLGTALTVQEGACYEHFANRYADDSAKARWYAEAMYARTRREEFAYYLEFLPAHEAWRRAMQHSGPKLAADRICIIWLK